MSQVLNTAIESLNALSLEEKHQFWQILEAALLSQSGRSLDFLYNEPDLYTLADGKPI